MAANAILLSNTMPQNNTNATTDDLKPTILHNFLGRESAPVTNLAAGSDAAGFSSVSGAGGRGGGPVSTTSDLASERQVGTLYEGVPFFGKKADISGSIIRYSGSKRGHADSGFMAPSREGVPQLRPDYPETSHLMKMLRNVGAERPRWPHEDELVTGVNQTRLASSSHIAQPASAPKWERAIPVNAGPVLQYTPRAGQGVTYGYQPIPNRFKDSNTGPPLMSYSAADEGSRTGIKGSGILNSVNVSGSAAEPSNSKLKSLISNIEPNSSTPPHQRSTSVSRQMTIFYGGQAHVFDDVHPNKADVIMALAGSNGGSWSTSLLPNSSLKPSGSDDTPLSGGSGKSSSMKDARGQKQAAGAEQKSEEKQ